MNSDLLKAMHRSKELMWKSQNRMKISNGNSLRENLPILQLDKTNCIHKSTARIMNTGAYI
jgi:hypothetical protein